MDAWARNAVGILATTLGQSHKKGKTNCMTSTKHNIFTRCSVLLALVALGGMLVLPHATNAATPAQSTGVDDYATEHIGAPWDMSDSSVFAFDYTRQFRNLSGLTLSNGVLSATSTNNDPRVTLLLPSPPAANPTLPEGGYAPINASVYKYLTVRVNVEKEAYAQVFWQAYQGAPFAGSAFQKVSPGWNTLVFDLTAGGQGSMGSWSGSIQGLYFDPMMSTGNFQIDYVRLSSARPSNPDNMPPVLQITAPSYVSGPDYAATELGDPWDMSNASDVTKTSALGTVSFDNGVLTAVGNCSGDACSDPQVVLRVGPRIDTSKYKYATYRMKIDSLPGVFPESVARFLWWSSIPEQASTSRDIVVYEGWRTVSIDLTKAKLEPSAFATWANSNPTLFRFDPHEESRPRTLHIDYVMLTGDNQANGSFDIRYNASDAEKQNLTTKFYYDGDAQGFDGQPITCASTTQSSIPDSKYKVYLPTLTQPGSAGSPVGGDTCRWNTSSVAAGTYYIYGVTTDGTNTTQAYSQTPVVVKH